MLNGNKHYDDGTRLRRDIIIIIIIISLSAPSLVTRSVVYERQGRVKNKNFYYYLMSHSSDDSWTVSRAG